jgi:hypothetical protein
LESTGSGSSQGTGFSEHSNQPSISVNDGEFFDWLSDKGLLKKDTASYDRCNIVREKRHSIRFSILEKEN